MYSIAAFIRLVRWPNLVFIVLTQYLFYYCVFRPSYRIVGAVPALSQEQLAWLSFSTVLLAAGGYIINDYFDVNIDLVNKPERTIVDRFITRRWAMWWHGMLSLAGVGISMYLGLVLSMYWLPLANLGCVILLFIYSLSWKKQLLIGNVVVSLLTAWVVGVFLGIVVSDGVHRHVAGMNYARITRIGVLYSAFAFIISMVREVVKDMEDVDGDRRYGCKTLPIALGYTTAKVFSGTWLVVLLGALSLVQVYVLLFRMWLSAIYCLSLVIAPLLYVFVLMVRAKTPLEYHHVSSLVKVVMLAGILSLVFFRYYA